MARMVHLSGRDEFARLLVAFAENGEEGETEFVIPEDLSALSDEELTALHEQAVSHFDALYGDGSNLSAETLAALTALTEGIETITTEIGTREAAAAERAEQAAQLAARAHPEQAEEGEAGDEGEQPETDAATEPVLEGQVVEGTEPEAVAASARREIRVNLQGMARRQPRVPAAVPQTIRDVMLAAGDGTGFAAGEGVDWLGVGRIVDRRLASFNQTQYEIAARTGQHLTQQFGVATIRKPIPADLMINSTDPDHVNAVFARAVDETRLPGGSLTAAGGWCAPSETLYDLLELESRDGLYSLPEIGISRGGVSWTTGPDFATIYNSTGFAYSEAQDIAGSYSGGTNEVQTVTITGSPTGGTFTLTYEGQTTAAIAYNATAAAVKTALVGLAAFADTDLTTAGGALPGTAVTVTFTGRYAGLDVALMTATGSFTGGSAPAVAVATTTPGVAGTGAKPCYRVPCPTFTEARLDVAGLCITAGLLQQRGYPEVISRTVRGALIAHDHKMSATVIAAVEAGSTPVTATASTVGTLAPLLDIIEKQVEHYRYIHRMPRGTTLEAVFPFWIRGAIRSDLALRSGVDLTSVTDAQISAWFSSRGVAAQFVYDWQPITGAAGDFVTWPDTVKFLLYAAGTWVKGTADIITMDTLYDSVLLGNNDFTALFTEEGWLVAKRGLDSRVVTVPVCSSGTTGGPDLLTCDGVAAA